MKMKLYGKKQHLTTYLKKAIEIQTKSSEYVFN